MGELKEKYQFQKEIGRGGFSVTWLARTRDASKKRVLIKELLLDKIDDWKAVENFEREARVLSHLSHENIPDFIDFLADESQRSFLVQEFIEGQDLAALIQEGKFFTEAEVIEMALTLARVLAHLHQTSPPLLHRDIKPSNIILRSQDQKVFLIDFGAAKGPSQLSGASGLTVTGTFGYMPLEQTEGRAVPASDLYALGMTLIFVLSHMEPHSLPKDAHLRPDFREYVNISEHFATVLDKLVEPDVRKRYARAEDLIQDLEALGERKPLKRVGGVGYQKNWAWALGVFVLLSYCAWQERKVPLQKPPPVVATGEDRPNTPSSSLPVMTVQSYRSMAHSFYRQKKYAKALPYYEKLKQLAPDDGEAHFYYAATLGSLNQSQKAIAAYQEVLERFPDENDYTRYNIGLNYYKLKQYERALPYFEAMREIRPKDPNVWNYLGILYIELERYPEAKKVLERALEVKPRFKYALYNLGRWHQVQGQSESALRYFEQASAVDKDYGLPHYRRAEIFYNLKKYPECVNAAQSAIAAAGSYANAHNRLGLCYRHLKAYDSALAEFRAALKDNPKLTLAQYNLALTLSDAGRKADAKAAYRKSLDMNPKHTPSMNNLALLLQAEGQFEEAESLYKAAFALTQKPLYSDNLGLLYDAQKRCDDAQREWQKACQQGYQKACQRSCD